MKPHFFMIRRFLVTGNQCDKHLELSSVTVSDESVVSIKTSSIYGTDFRIMFDSGLPPKNLIYL